MLPTLVAVVAVVVEAHGSGQPQWGVSFVSLSLSSLLGTRVALGGSAAVAAVVVGCAGLAAVAECHPSQPASSSGVCAAGEGVGGWARRCRCCRSCRVRGAGSGGRVPSVAARVVVEGARDRGQRGWVVLSLSLPSSGERCWRRRRSGPVAAAAVVGDARGSGRPQWRTSRRSPCCRRRGRAWLGAAATENLPSRSLLSSSETRAAGSTWVGGSVAVSAVVVEGARDWRRRRSAPRHSPRRRRRGRARHYMARRRHCSCRR